MLGTRMQTQLFQPVVWPVTPADLVRSLRQLKLDGH